jgi:hypothetical protein
MANLFDKSKAKATTKKAEKHEIVNISKEFGDSLARISKIDMELASLEAERVTLDSEVREEAKEAMAKLYQSKNSFPGTIKVLAGSHSFMFITSDKYIKIDEERGKELRKIYGNDCVSDTTVFTLNSALVEKYSDELSNLIMSSKKITEEDKEKLIESNTTWAIAKGTVNNLRTGKFAKRTISEIIEDIKPIFSIKSIKKEV